MSIVCNSHYFAFETNQKGKEMVKTYTIEGASELLNTPVGTLRKYRSEIGGSKLGRRWIFSEQELIDWMISKRRKPIRELEHSK